MQQSPITFIINGKTYRIDSNNSEAIRLIPKADRQQLVMLLEAVKQQDTLSEMAIQQSTAKVNVAATQAEKPHRLSNTDADDLMARLIMEEKKQQKPALNTQSIYKGAAAVIAVIFILVLFF
jgi:hypothetical protein